MALSSAWLGALGRLERFPAGAGRGVAEDVRVAADHLGRDRRHDVIEREGADLLGHAGMIDDLELEIAELVLERVHVAAVDRVGDLIGFLDRVGRDRREGLDAVPFAAGGRIAQPGHDLDQAGEAGAQGKVRPGTRHWVSPIIYIM